MIAGNSRIVWRIARIGCASDVQVGDVHEFEILALQVRQQLIEMRKSLGAHGKWTIFVLKIDIQVNHVGWDSVLAQPNRDLAHPLFIVVAISRLLKAQGPQGRKRGEAGKPSISADHSFWVRPIENIVVDRPALRPEEISVLLHTPKIKAGGPGVIHQHARGAAGAQDQKKRNAFVNRIRVLLKSE